jgi:uncharacterized protein (TIGR02001 family)
MISKSNAFQLRALAAGIGAVLALGALTPAHAELTGNINAVSKYVLRGITNNAENDNTTIQGGIDYNHSSGLYAGYWGSNLDYSSFSSTTTGFENDIYAGYKGKSGAMSYSLGGIYYNYTQVKDSNGLEVVGTLGTGPLTFGFKYLTKDLAWGNKGDIYWTVDYSQPLPQDFTFGASLGYYTYKKTGKFLKDPDPTTGQSAKSAAFRHLNLSLTHPLGKTGATMGVTFIMGGEDRYGTDQKDTVVLSLGSTF